MTDLMSFTSRTRKPFSDLYVITALIAGAARW